jgi:hypothetical protein
VYQYLCSIAAYKHVPSLSCELLIKGAHRELRDHLAASEYGRLPNPTQPESEGVVSITAGARPDACMHVPYRFDCRRAVNVGSVRAFDAYWLVAHYASQDSENEFSGLLLLRTLYILLVMINDHVVGGTLASGCLSCATAAARAQMHKWNREHPFNHLRSSRIL